MQVRRWESREKVKVKVKESVSQSYTDTREHTLPVEIKMTCGTCCTQTCITSAEQTHCHNHPHTPGYHSTHRARMMDDTVVKPQHPTRGASEREREA